MGIGIETSHASFQQEQELKIMIERILRGKGGRVGRGQGRGSGRGGGNKPGSGPGGDCVCPKCGHREPHAVGERCIDRACPKCGTKMIRE
jgi:hypothetical protein